MIPTKLGFVHAEIKVISRTSKEGGVANAIEHSSYISGTKRKAPSINESAYISGTALSDVLGTTVADYTHKSGVLYSAVELPANAPREYFNPNLLWAAVEAVEKNANAQLYREIIFAFDKNLTHVQVINICKRISKVFADQGMAVEFAIHAPKEKDGFGNGNIHCHFMLTTRGFSKDGSFESKQERRPYVLDENGHKIPVIEPQTGLQKKRPNGGLCWQRERAKDLHDWNTPSWWENTKRLIIDMENEVLKRNGLPIIEDYEKLGIPHIPEPKIGKTGEKIGHTIRYRLSNNSEIVEEIFEKIMNSDYFDKQSFIDTVIGITPSRDFFLTDDQFSIEKISEYFKSEYYSIQNTLSPYKEKRKYSHYNKYQQLLMQLKEDIVILNTFGLTSEIYAHLIRSLNSVFWQRARILDNQIRCLEKKIKHLKTLDSNNILPKDIHDASDFLSQINASMRAQEDIIEQASEEPTVNHLMSIIDSLSSRIDKNDIITFTPDVDSKNCLESLVVSFKETVSALEVFIKNNTGLCHTPSFLEEAAKELESFSSDLLLKYKKPSLNESLGHLENTYPDIMVKTATKVHNKMSDIPISAIIDSKTDRLNAKGKEFLLWEIQYLIFNKKDDYNIIVEYPDEFEEAINNLYYSTLNCNAQDSATNIISELIDMILKIIMELLGLDFEI